MQNLFHQDQIFFSESRYWEITSTWYLFLFFFKLSSICGNFANHTCSCISIKNVNILEQRLIICIILIPNLRVKVLASYQ